MNNHIASNDAIPLTDAVVIPRMSWKPLDQPAGLLWREQLHSNGVSMIAEWDDDVFSKYFHHQAKETGRADGLSMAELDAQREARLFVLRIADGVTVSTQRLATVVRQYTEAPVEVVPNAIDLDWWRKVLAQAQRKIPSPTIGWAGGRRPDGDVEQMAQAWGRIAARRSDVTFVVGGFYPLVIDQYVPEHRLVRIPWLPLESYPVAYYEMDIGCCPIADTTFNRSKSFVKAMELAASGAAVVASPTVYGQLIHHGKTGYLAESADQWEWALERLLDKPSHRQSIARKLLRVVEKEHSLKANALRWPMAWTNICVTAQERWAGRTSRQEALSHV